MYRVVNFVALKIQMLLLEFRNFPEFILENYFFLDKKPAGI